jgi:hypothetical protein
MRRSSRAVAAIVALWLVAGFILLFSAVQGATAARAGQLVAGLCVILAGVLVAVDWMGVATAMAERRARRWGGRLPSMPEARDPAVAARSTRLLAGWWVAFGVLVMLFALAGR